MLNYREFVQKAYDSDSTQVVVAVPVVRDGHRCVMVHSVNVSIDGGEGEPGARSVLACYAAHQWNEEGG